MRAGAHLARKAAGLCTPSWHRAVELRAQKSHAAEPGSARAYRAVSMHRSRVARTWVVQHHRRVQYECGESLLDPVCAQVPARTDCYSSRVDTGMCDRATGRGSWIGVRVSVRRRGWLDSLFHLHSGAWRHTHTHTHTHTHRHTDTDTHTHTHTHTQTDRQTQTQAHKCVIVRKYQNR